MGSSHPMISPIFCLLLHGYACFTGVTKLGIPQLMDSRPMIFPVFCLLLHDNVTLGVPN